MGDMASRRRLGRSGMADDREEGFEASPATRLLDALGRGDLNAALLEFRPTTIVRTEDRTWSLQGEEQVLYGLEDALNLFPGLVFDSHARHIGHGRVIEEARVRDLGPLDALDDGSDDVVPADAEGSESPDGRAAGGNGPIVLDRDFGKSEKPRLNMPMRLTVQHDDQSVHEIILSFPRALLRAALGHHVDQLDLSVSEIQSAFVAPVGSGFTTHQLGTKPVPSLEFAPPPPPPEPTPEPVPVAQADSGPGEPYLAAPFVLEEDEEPRSRAKVIVPLVVVVVGAIAGGAWWLGQGTGTPEADAKTNKPGHSASQSGNSNKPTKNPSSAQASATKNPDPTKTPKPDVVLKSDLAFPKNSAALSEAAKTRIAQIAGEIRAAKLKGRIDIYGYTDTLGSAAHGLTLSQDRASAVAQYLRSQLGSYHIGITAVGLGEADPIASNATEAGRQKNRRVTITLPPPT
jgi:outer membrane protein OmpA-like peptidoglycan-associated protein